MDTTLDPTVVNLAKAIRQRESGGNFNVPKGKAGEVGAYQFTPDTWNAVAPKYGINVPIEQATPQQQNAVAYNRIKSWKDSGKNVTQIASMWNAGEGEPDAYTGKFSSTTPTHKAGDPSMVTGKYDVPGYAKDVSEQYLKLKGSTTSEQPVTPPPDTTTLTPPPSSPYMGPELTKGQSLIDFGGVGTGPIDLTAPILEQAVKSGKDIWNSIKQHVSSASDTYTKYLEGKDKSVGSAFQTGANMAADVTGAVAAPITETLGKAVGAVVSPVLKPFIDAIGDSPAMNALTDVMSKHPKIAETLSSLIETGLNMSQLEVGGKTPEAIKTTVEKGLPEVPGLGTKSFESTFNDVVPVLKNDVRNLPKKYDNARTALSDIVDNKDTLGLTDKAGNSRLPENFVETAQAQDIRMKQLYKDYTAKLSGVDKTKFDTDIQTQIKTQIDDIKAQIDKENSLAGRKALTRQMTELSTLRDTSPEGIQNYVESLNQQAKTAPGVPPSIGQIKAANLAGKMRSVLDDSIDKIDGKGYQDLRNIYGAHRATRDQFLMAAKKEINATPGLTEKLANLGVSAEGLNFLLTHNPQSLLIALGVKGGGKLMKWFNSPQRALNNLYKGIESGNY